jgi:hypothetical protein
MKQLIGYAMVSALAIALFVVQCLLTGWINAVIMWTAIGFTIAWLSVATRFIKK